MLNTTKWKMDTLAMKQGSVEQFLRFLQQKDKEVDLGIPEADRFMALERLICVFHQGPSHKIPVPWKFLKEFFSRDFGHRVKRVSFKVLVFQNARL